MGVHYTKTKYSHVFTAQRKINNKLHKRAFSCTLYHPERLVEETRAKAVAYDEELAEKQRKTPGARFNIFQLNKKSKYPILNGIVLRIVYSKPTKSLSVSFVMQITSLRSKMVIKESRGILVRPLDTAWMELIDIYCHELKFSEFTKTQLILYLPRVQELVDKYKASYLADHPDLEIVKFYDNRPTNWNPRKSQE